MRHLYILILFISACGPSTSEKSSQPDGERHEDEETGSIVYVPEDREDVGVEGGADVANETTGAYLSVPGKVRKAGPSTNVTADDPVSDVAIAKWTIEIPLKVEAPAGKHAALFYHVIKEDGKKYYGILTGDDLSVTDDKIQAKMVGLGNYQPGFIDTEVDSTEISTSDEILKSNQASLYTNRLLQLNDRIFAGMERNYVQFSDNDGKTWTDLSDVIPSIIIRDMIADDDGRLILATGLGVAISDDNGKSFALIDNDDGLPDFAVNAVHYSNNRLYIATAKGAAVIENNKVTKVYTADNDLPSSYVNDIYYDDVNDLLYIATNKGLAVVENGASSANLTYTESTGNLADNDAKSIALDSSQRVFVATNNGLSYKSVGASEFSTVGLDFGLESDETRDVAIQNNKVYLATARKLSVLEIDNAGNLLDPVNIGEDEKLIENRILSVTVDESRIFTSHRTGASISTNSGTSFEPIDFN